MSASVMPAMTKLFFQLSTLAANARRNSAIRLRIKRLPMMKFLLPMTMSPITMPTTGAAMPHGNPSAMMEAKIPAS